MKVVKFGGSSVANASQCKKVLKIIQSDPERQIVVVSAPGKRQPKDHKITDMLYLTYQMASIGMGGQEIFKNIADRYLEIQKEIAPSFDLPSELKNIQADIMFGGSEEYSASRGEYLMAKILAAALDFEFVDAKDVICFSADGDYDPELTKKKLLKRVANKKVVIPGFYGAMEDGTIKTFSRGGSDITGAILASALDADLYENWTDVSGFLAADPSIVKDPKPIRIVTYEELHELSYMGAQVLHGDAIGPARAAGIPIHIKNTNHPEDEGTLIVPETEDSKRVVTGIAGKKDFTVVYVKRPNHASASGFFRRLCSVFEANECEIEHLPTSIDTASVVVKDGDFARKKKKILEEIDIFCNPDQIKPESGLSLVAVVGQGMARTKGVSARIFSALAQSDVNIRMISQGASEMNIIIGIATEQFEQAIQAIYNEFFQDSFDER